MSNNKHINSLPTIGILIFDGFLCNEVVAPLDTFSRKDSTGKQLFKVVLIGKENRAYESEEGLKVLPDYTFESSPLVNVLVIPGSMNPDDQVNDPQLLSYIKKLNETAEYITSHCSGAFVLGASGIAGGRKVVTYCGGSKALQDNYPNLLVQDDKTTTTVRDGRFFSSNGNLVSYTSCLELLETLTCAEHRQYVESELLINKLK